jgi:chitosanase
MKIYPKENSLINTKLRKVALNLSLSLLSASALLACGGGAVSEQGAQQAQALAGKLRTNSVDLNEATKKEHAQQIVAAAENSTLLWRTRFEYIEDIKDERGYTAGIIGFCSGTGDMLAIVKKYTAQYPGNGLASYLPALELVNGSESHEGLDPDFPADWKREAALPAFQAAQIKERDDSYFNPSVSEGKKDGLRALGQFIYYDAAVMHGMDEVEKFRARAILKSPTPAQGGNEVSYLSAFMDERVAFMESEEAHKGNIDRVQDGPRKWLAAGNLDLNTPLNWRVNAQDFSIP